MNEITIDDVAYELDALSDAAKQQLANLQVTDAEIQRLQSLLAIATTARAAYAAALKSELPAAVPH
jgi:Family of unknown function (DUF6447)